MSRLIIDASEDGQARIQLRADAGSVWLTQLEIAELFQTTKQNVNLHAKNIFDGGELSSLATDKNSLSVQNEGSRQVRAAAATQKGELQ